MVYHQYCLDLNDTDLGMTVLRRLFQPNIRECKNKSFEMPDFWLSLVIGLDLQSEGVIYLQSPHGKGYLNEEYYTVTYIYVELMF